MVLKIVGEEEAFYILMLHKGKTDLNGKTFSTNCGRVLPRKDKIVPGADLEKCKCSQCFGKKFKTGDLVTLTPKAKQYLESMSLEDAPWKVVKVQNRKVWIESKLNKCHVIHEVHLMLSEVGSGSK
jgi:hypothetical protein